jgi:adenylate cyclase
MAGMLKRLFTRGWRGMRAAGSRRLALTLLLLTAALLLCRYSWEVPTPKGLIPTPVTGDAERALFDLRSFLLARQTSQDPRVALVVYNDQTLINTKKRSPLDRGLLARALANLDKMNAKAIGIDVLFDQPQDEDPQLIAQLRAMRTPTWVAYAEVGTNAENIIYEQQKYLENFLGRLKGSQASPASIRLTTDFGVTRVWPEPRADLPPPIAAAMAGSPGYRGSIRFRRPRGDPSDADFVPLYSEIPIDQFADPAVAPYLSPAIKDRYVLIGGDIVDTDRVATPLTSAANSAEPPGVAIHADMLTQILDNAPASPPAPWFVWAEALLVVIAAALTALLEMKAWKVGLLLLGQLMLFAGLPFYLQSYGTDTYGFPSLGPALGWLLAFTSVVSAARASGAVQRKFAQGALGKYLPREMAQEIIDHPELLALHGEKKDICVLFSDLEGFTKMSHALEPEMVAKLLNRYLETLSQVVLANGGVIDKFVGDAVVAFWGAPIARPDDAVRAARAGHALWLAGEGFRSSVDAGLPPVGRTRVGLHFGAAVVGNFGGESRIQYTALGDAMNTASRLESANKQLQTNVLASREFVERCDLEWWRPMGRVILRGRAQPVDVFDAAPEFPEAERNELAKALALLGEDPDKGLRLLEQVARRNPADTALQNLLRRSQHLNQEGAYVLD